MPVADQYFNTCCGSGGACPGNNLCPFGAGRCEHAVASGQIVPEASKLLFLNAQKIMRMQTNQPEDLLMTPRGQRFDGALMPGGLHHGTQAPIALDGSSH